MTLKIFNVVGAEVAVLVNQELVAGRYKAGWEAGNLNGGVYFYRLRSCLILTLVTCRWRHAS